MSYAASFPDIWRRAANYIDRLLKGAKPADLPVEQPTKFELEINFKTANVLGFTAPPALLAEARNEGPVIGGTPAKIGREAT
jgi:putative tryptophan/tyrosine transport system substrate-binding protein